MTYLIRLAQVRIAWKTLHSHGSGARLILALCFAMATLEQLAAFIQQQQQQQTEIVAAIHQLTQQIHHVHQTGAVTASPNLDERRFRELGVSAGTRRSGRNSPSSFGPP